MSDERPKVTLVVEKTNKDKIVDCVLKHTNPDVASISLKDETEEDNMVKLTYDTDPSEEGHHIMNRFISELKEMNISVRIDRSNF